MTNPYSDKAPRLWTAAARKAYSELFRNADNPGVCCHGHKACAAYSLGPCSVAVESADFDHALKAWEEKNPTNPFLEEMKKAQS